MESFKPEEKQKTLFDAWYEGYSCGYGDADCGLDMFSKVKDGKEIQLTAEEYYQEENNDGIV